MRFIKNEAAALHHWGKLDSDWSKNNPNAKWYYRDPIDGEWDGFKLITLKGIISHATEDIIHGTSGQVEYKICVLRISKDITTRWPAAYNVDEDEYLILSLDPEDPKELFRVHEDDLQESLQRSFEEAERTGWQEMKNGPDMDHCLGCKKAFDHADLIFSAVGYEPAALCESCYQIDKYQVVGAGIYFSNPPKESKIYKDKLNRNVKRLEKLIGKKDPENYQ
jgi:hypothetical protein